MRRSTKQALGQALRKSSGSLAIFAAIRRALSRPVELAYCCFFFGAGAVGAGRTSAPGVVRLLIGNFLGRRLIIVVQLLLLFLFFYRERTFGIPLQGNVRRYLRGSACGQQGQRPNER